MRTSVPTGRWLLPVTAVAALLIATIAPATAAAADTPAADQPDYPTMVMDGGDHAMGSQIRKHEGGETGVIRPIVIDAAVYGMDVSGWQGNVNWSGAWANGARFAYVKATEGTGYTNPYFAQQYNGSYNVGMIRGAYHFARPNVSGGTTQANYFVDHGGGWSRDGKTLPGTLDIEYNPYGSTCYGLSATSMVYWIKAFSDQYHARTSRWPVIYTTTNWWSQCTGNLGDFTSTNPLWVARYASTVGALPYAWSFYTFWQYSDSGVFPGDQDLFNGGYDRLQALANG
jgi:GH25 family lysozyme M1 (1,4-beta-N-acetylmuramidase)